MTNHQEDFRTLLKDYLMSRGKLPSDIVAADDYLLNANGHIFQLRLGQDGSMLLSTMVLYHEDVSEEALALAKEGRPEGLRDDFDESTRKEAEAKARDLGLDKLLDGISAEDRQDLASVIDGAFPEELLAVFEQEDAEEVMSGLKDELVRRFVEWMQDPLPGDVMAGAIAEFNAFHMFSGGFCVLVDETTGSLYVEQELAINRFDAASLRRYMKSFADRAASCARWCQKEMSQEEPATDTQDAMIFA